MDAMPRLAAEAAARITAGALNGHTVADLAAELGVSERHLRRAVERATGVSPIALAQTQRLLLAKQLLADTSLSVTQIAFASGFQSLRRFNGVFRERYRLSPSAVRRPRAGVVAARRSSELVRLTLGYRAPLAWDALTTLLGRSLLPGVECLAEERYGRTVRLDGRSGVVFVDNAAASAASKAHLTVDVSPALLSTLMPLLFRLRRLFDLDAEPTLVDAHLSRTGLARQVAARPGLRVPGAFDGFETALALLLGTAPDDVGRRVIAALGEPLVTDTPGLGYLAPDARRVAREGAAALHALGLPRRLADTIERVARAVAGGVLRLEPGADPIEARRTLTTVLGVEDPLATTILMRALRWPDAFPDSCGDVRAEAWRPWRAYAALHLA